MARREYRPGDGWTLLTRGDLTVLVPAAQPEDLLGRLWDALGADAADLYAVLDVFAAAFGLARMPAFAVAEHGERLSLLVRGAVRATVTTPSGEEAFSGSDVGTWLERAFEAWDAVEVSGAPAGAVEPGAPRGPLPLLGGVVPADTVLVTADRGAHPRSSDDGAGPAEAAAAPGAVARTGAAGDRPTPAGAAPAVTADAPAASEETLLPESTVAGSTLAGTAPAPSAATPSAAAPSASADSDGPAAQPGETRADENQPDETRAGAAPPAAEEAPEATSSTSDYDHLWGTTVLRSVEDAAVRIEGDDEEPAASEPAASQPDDAGAPGPEALSPAHADPQSPPGGEEPAAERDHAPSDAEAEKAGAPAAWSPPSLLIDAVPWGKPLPARPEPAPGAQPQQRPRPRAQSEMRYPEPLRDGAAPDSAAQGRSITSELYGDHDGETVMRSELEPASLAAEPGQDGAAPPAASAGARAAATGPLVLGRRCPQGHASPPSYPQCAVCGEHLQGDPVQVPRPALGRVVFSTGEVIDLVQPLVVGRQPSVARVASGGMPRLVSVTSPSGDISRNHLEVRLEGWHVMLRDLKATNGTVLERPGQAPRRLAQGEMTIVLDGDVADLGDGVSLRFEAVP
ncbi:FHA domain-containing protein [Sinomonas atrocyanea]|uniref:FHA domain-containing protein n=1 Tax=Sinomonas atrocyanea TaxID=37927 RepID=UPI00285F69AE|nr:FHA domain-containing protein [Sinomonas atrocyanea]MDR6621773.1 hypothetical protein [Sinomonas atrocyanea]